MSTQVDLLKKYGLPVRGLSGQHLLIDANIQKKIVEALEVEPKESVLEIGPGLGALTGHLLEAGCDLTVVEKDPRFVQVLEGEYGSDYAKSFRVIHKDILKYDFDNLSRKNPEKQWKVISNLPYYITAPIIFYLCEQRKRISKAVLMMQKEVARRVSANPGTKDYGKLTLAVRYYADAKLLFDVAPGCFTPKPKVDSSVIELSFHREARLPNLNERLLFFLIRTAFSQRRKTFLGLLTHTPLLRKEKPFLLSCFEEKGWNEKIRGEELLLKDYMFLTEQLQNKGIGFDESEL